MKKPFYVVDGHCDSIQAVRRIGRKLVKSYNFSNQYPQLQFVAFFCGRAREDADESYERLCSYIAHFHAEMESERDVVEQVRTYADIERVFASGKHAALMTIEGGTGLKGSAQVLRDAYDAGVRVTGLAWVSNDLAKSNRLAEGEEDTGLTSVGREIVEEGNRLGMIFDCSHLSDRSFWDLCKIAQKPVVATHSNLRSVCNHSRNLTEEMAREIARQGGMIGLNFYPDIIAGRAEEQDIDHLFRHMERMIEITGEDHIGFGGDVDGIDSYPAPLTLERSVHDQVLERMFTHNYPEKLIRKIAYENWLSFLKKYL